MAVQVVPPAIAVELPALSDPIADDVRIPFRSSLLQKVRRFSGPGILVAVGYMDPGNWATDIQAGSQFGFSLLWVVVLAGVAAMFLQMMAARLALVTGQDLAQLSRDSYGPVVRTVQWLGAEVSIVACDISEVLGCALALKLLFGLPLALGVVLTAFDTVLVLTLQKHGFRKVEAIVLGLVLTISVCFVLQLTLLHIDWRAVGLGLVPGMSGQDHRGALIIALGIVGATIMPHNLYLHSAVVRSRRAEGPDGRASLRETLSLSRIDTAVALVVAMAINAALLILAGSAFHAAGNTGVNDIEQAYKLLEPLAGGFAALLFGVALLASGQSSTLTGTIAGQVILDGFLRIRLPVYQRRLITRSLALLPALAGVLWLGDGGIGRLLVWTQVVLSMQLPLAMWPLIRLSNDPTRMGRYASGRLVKAAAWSLFALISAANLTLLLVL